ncbi:hypothetical protein GCK72_013741 [Caenorhabditis remanei]|uniref:EGF-like domain-containing protein n=1 Tax=Caenorhabditis remanei TaxID=31234 RepID=A0A6A5GRV5_CAERE|nr:hypothetical protein GCK72_013741 [Caenorhabditis remanei]KAF1757286.1 hypothetical protein GCK72_013741 [Caenorhabditis remanei]
MPMRMMAVKPGDKLEIEYYNPTKISRFVKNAKGVEIEHVFRVCNGKNKAKCGYWENVKTKKKVARATTYNKKKNILTVPKMKAADAGTYRDNNYDTMKFLSAVLVLLVASSHVLGDSSSTVTTTPASEPSTSTPVVPTDGSSASTVTEGSTASAGTGSTVSAGTGPTAAPGSTVTDESNTGSTVPAGTTTPTPLKLSTFPVSNDVTVLDAKLILQQAVQLNQQINALNDYLKKAQADTDPNKSPLFAQLNSFSTNITAQNTTLQGYVTKLQALADTQSNLDKRVTSATNTFVCFSQSSCVTDVPTTPEPTSPGPTPSVTPCTNKTLITDDTKTLPYSFDNTQNAAQCVVSVKSKDSTYNVTVTLNATFTGSDAWVRLVETRTQNSVTFNGSISDYVFTAFQEVDVFYYSGPRSTVQFNFDYKQVDNCNLNCTGDNGKCRVSQSGVQYCECKKCEYTGDFCETPLADPCQSKQKRVCGQNADPQYGLCYKNACFDQCYACECAPGADTDSPQKCKSIQNPSPPVLPTGDPVCPSTAAPTTTPALFTSTVSLSGSTQSSGTVNPSQPTDGSTASPASTGTTVTADPNASTASTVTTPAPSSSTVVSSTETLVASTATSNSPSGET